MVYDPTTDDDSDDPEYNLLDVEGREGFSWERLDDTNNAGEGWGQDNGVTIAGRRRRRRYAGDPPMEPLDRY